MRGAQVYPITLLGISYLSIVVARSRSLVAASSASRKARARLAQQAISRKNITSIGVGEEITNIGVGEDITSIAVGEGKTSIGVDEGLGDGADMLQ